MLHVLLIARKRALEDSLASLCCYGIVLKVHGRRRRVESKTQEA